MELMLREMMKELNCYMCEQFLEPPVSMCKGGHSICRDCTKKNVICACEHKITKTVNILAQGMLNRISSFKQDMDLLVVYKMDYLLKNILQNLKCQMCYEFTSAPIVFCEGHHNICSNCRKTSRRCPVCDEHFCEIRNETIESFAVMFLRPCKNESRGCEGRFPQQYLKNHEEHCPYKPHRCPYGTYAQDCDWKGPISEIKKHIVAYHQFLVRKLTDVDIVYLRKYKNSKSWSEIAEAFGEYFYCFFEKDEKSLLGYVLHVGKAENAEKYKYDLKLLTKTGTESASFNHITSSFLSEKIDLFNIGKYAQFCNNFVSRCIDPDGNLTFHLKIRKIVPI